MALSILGRVGFPFLSSENTMPTVVCSGTVYTWKETFIQGAGWKTHRLTLFEDGTLVWDEPQQNDRVKGCAQLSKIFRRIGVGTLYNSLEQQKAAAKRDLNIQEYGLLLPFSRGDGGLELSQFAVTSVGDLRRWMEAFAAQMDVEHILRMVADRKSQYKAARTGKRDSVCSEKFWLDETAARRARDRAPSVAPTAMMNPKIESRFHSTTFKASECADIWREFQETYHVCMSAAAGSQQSGDDRQANMRRSWSSRSFYDGGNPGVAGASYDI